MLNNLPQPKLFIQHQLLVVSTERQFQHRVRGLSRGHAEYANYRYLSSFPRVEALNKDIFYAVIIDINDRPDESLHWISLARQNGFTMPVIAIGSVNPDPQAFSIRRVYDIMAWQILDATDLTTERLAHCVSLLLMEYAIAPRVKPTRDQDSEYMLAFDVIEEVVLKLDSNFRIEYANAAAELMLGVDANMVVGQNFLKRYDFFDDETKTSLNSVLERKLHGQTGFKLDGPLLLLGNNVQIAYVGIGCAPIMANGSDVVGYFIILRDLTEHHSLSSKLHYHSSHDQLSGLLSRMEFEARLQQAINSANDLASDNPTKHVLIFLDIDQFRIINDTCGHAVGDELIRQFSMELSSIVRKRDTLARVGGDEFAIILWNCPESKGIEIANHIRTHVEAFRFVWVDKIHQVTISVGLTSIKPGMLSSWAEALRLVDGACDTAKEFGRNRVEITNPDDQRMQDRYGEMEWVHRLVAAVEGQGLVLFCQAIQPSHLALSDSDQHSHFEVLVRYQDTDGKLVPPGVFLPPAERYNLMGMIDRWVVRSTIQWIANREGSKQIDICSINLSGASMCDKHMPDFIKNLFKINAVDPSCVCFEITETVAVTNIASATDFIRELKAIGCKFALDDFGVGMSSFAYLKHMDVDFVKIDGSFVKNIVSDPIDKEMVRSINDIGHILGKKTVAEFCEDQSCFDMLIHLGVDYVQGYFIGKPLPIDSIMDIKPKP